MSGFSNFAVSFSIISVLAGCITSFGLAMSSGGPIAIWLGWPLVGVFVLCVALAMGEICSVYPTAGGLYFWAGRLARKNTPAWGWTATPVHTFILFAVILLSHGLLNTFGVNLLAMLSNFSAWWHLVGVAI